MQWLRQLFDKVRYVDDEAHALRLDLEEAQGRAQAWERAYREIVEVLGAARDDRDLWKRNYHELANCLLAERQRKEETEAFQRPFRSFVDGLFVRKRDGDDGLMHAAVGFAGEAAECLDLVKKTWVYGKPLDEAKLLTEMGDAYHYFTMLMIKLGITLQPVIDGNIAKLMVRYPNGYTDQAAIERKDVASG